MKIVIDMSEEQYNRICNHTDGIYDMTSLLIIVENGTPLQKETVTEFADRCRECGREKVLDKIRTEIENINVWDLRYAPTDSKDTRPQIVGNVKNHIIEIIDKYKAESEKKG